MKKILLLVLLLLLLPLTLSKSVTPAMAETTTFFLDPSNITGPPPSVGETLTLTLRVNTITDMYLWVADIEWDAAVFDLVGNPVEGNALKSGGYSTTFLWASLTDGKINDLTCTRLGNVTGESVPPNPNDMATLTFRVQTLTLGTTITITFARWMNSASTEYIPTTTGTYIRLSPSQTVRNFHLYGSASLGWGFTPTSMTSPGPNIQIYKGETVNLTLTSQDGFPHKFYVDYNANNIPDVGEPTSPQFTTTINYSFTANMSGSFKYRCAFHPIVMLGNFKVVVPGRTWIFHLYGDASLGWGFTSTNITFPGPAIQVYQGDIVNLTLTSQDGLAHQFFVDYNNNSAVDPGEPNSTVFTGTTTYSFIADTLGNFKYRCTFHPAIMLGNFKVKIPGDINGDGIVNIGDVSIIGVNWQKTVPPAPTQADINGDGIINIGDVSIIGVHWQQHI